MSFPGPMTERLPVREEGLIRMFLFGWFARSEESYDWGKRIGSLHAIRGTIQFMSCDFWDGKIR